MISTLFRNGQRIIVQVLDWAQLAWQNTFENRINDYSQAGIVQGELGEFTIIAGSNSTPTTPSISVGAGIAYDPNVNRIYISLLDTTTYNSSNPSQTTNDGTGNFISTPQSSGCVNVPLTINTFNYIWIDYLGTIDPTQFTLQDFTNAKQFYQESDGYVITITTVNIAPDANSIYLGSVNLTGSGVVSSTTISQTGRTYSANLPYRTLIETPATNLSDRTTIYTLGNTYFADQHTKAVGTGTVSSTNPHGLSPTDIGLSGSSTIQFHQEYLHSPGLVGGTDNLQAQIISVVPGFDQLVVNPIGPNEVITSNGVSLTSTDIPNATTFQYSSSDASGIWYIYVDIVNKIVNRTQTNLIVTPNPNQYVIYTVIYTYPDPDTSNGHLTSLTDYRVFGNIATREIQAGAVTGIKIASSAVAEGLSKDGSNNIQVNVDNVSIDINGSNDLAVKGTGVAGNGLVGSGTTVNVNPDGTSINIVSNQVEVANNGITPAKLNTSVAGSGLTGGGGAPLSISDGAITTRIHFNFPSTNLGTNGALVNIANYLFSIPSTTQPVLVNWYFTFTVGSGSSSHAQYPMVGIGIDGQAVGYVNTPTNVVFPHTYTFPSGTTFSAPGAGGSLSQVISPLTIIVPELYLASGNHTLGLYLIGGFSLSGVVLSCDMYLQWSFK